MNNMSIWWKLKQFPLFDTFLKLAWRRAVFVRLIVPYLLLWPVVLWFSAHVGNSFPLILMLLASAACVVVLWSVYSTGEAITEGLCYQHYLELPLAARRGLWRLAVITNTYIEDCVCDLDGDDDRRWRAINILTMAGVADDVDTVMVCRNVLEQL